jgi:drug/metabolite transporter (DMT)-like permease
MIHDTSGRWRLGLALSLLTVLLWGLLPLTLTMVLQTLDPLTVTWFRFFLSFILLASYLGIRGQLPKLRQLSSRTWLLLATASIFLASNYILFLQGLKLTSAGNAEVLIQLAPLLMGLGGLLVFREQYTIIQWFGVSVLTIGLILFFHDKLNNLITDPKTYIFGSCLVLLGAVVWAIYALAQKQLLQALSSSQIMVITYGICSLIFSFTAQPKLILNLNNLHWYALVFCGLNTLIAYGSFAESLVHWEASCVGAVIATAPIVTLISVDIVSVIAPTVIAPEQLTMLGNLGAILIVGGSIMVTLGRRS